jgi:hypothetical protein
LLAKAARISVQPYSTVYLSAEANKALQRLNADPVYGMGVLLM